MRHFSLLTLACLRLKSPSSTRSVLHARVHRPTCTLSTYTKRSWQRAHRSLATETNYTAIPTSIRSTHKPPSNRKKTIPLHSNSHSNCFKMHNMSVVERTIMADGIEWRYITDGTAEWGLHFPEARGDCQSPININSRQSVYDSSLNQPSLNADYALCRECEMVNTGNTVQISVKYKPDGVMAGLGKSEPPPRSVLTGGPLALDSTYELAEFTFHWGKEDDRGSEHTVNGKAYPMELHLIHWNSQLYETVEEAMGRDDGIAIVALFIQVGREHVGLRTLTDYLETVQSKGKSISITTPFHPTCLLPDPMLRDFWSYQGSLTTPPCNEKVTWILFRYPLTISHTQMEEFRRLKNYPKGGHPAADDDGFLADNFRPTQPLNDRVVRASFQ